MSAPTIPQRPARSQPPASSSSLNPADIPKIPPRPKRSVERSVSPHRESYDRSPLNDPNFVPGHSKPLSREVFNRNVPPRPPSVTLPSVGQEGSEYDNLQGYTSADEGSPEQTKGIAKDLPLHAPTASLPASSAKSRIIGVTRTDSNQAAAAGLGKASNDALGTPASTSARSSSSKPNTRPSSIYGNNEEEHGIPEIGLQVPMYPNAGDVQAPTPAPSNAPSTGIGFFNNGSNASLGGHHKRTKSGRDIFHGPPGSYGRHGHGLKPQDEFERAWYEKHPEDAMREKQGEYGPHISENRKEWHLSRDDLNKLVRESASRGVGMGTSAEAVSTPDEQIGYIASEEFASRIASPRPPSTRPASIHPPKGRASSSHSHTAESPLRKMSFPDEVKGGGDHAVEDEEDDNVIHIDPPARRESKVHGGGYDPPTENLGPRGGNTENEGGWITENGPGVPILASDEIAKHPEAMYLQPAVSPELERRGDDYITSDNGTPEYVSGRSRPASRGPNVPSISRFQSQDEERTGTPLEDVKEYEPLFPDDDDHKPTNKAVDNLKRPSFARHHFPSQDVWEDTPSSSQLVTEVSTPLSPEEKEHDETYEEQEPSRTFEKPEKEEARKQDITEKDRENFLPDHTKRFAKSHIPKDVRDDVAASSGRPGMQRRFPSHDIWEDTPDELQLVTTVETPQREEAESPAEPSSAAEDKPQIPPRPEKETAPSAPAEEKPPVPARPETEKEASPTGVKPAAEEKKSVPQIPPRPVIPARPARAKPSVSTEAKESSPVDKKPPVIPERPKPQIPARPARLTHKESADKVHTEGATAAAEAPAPKPKPAIPARPGGSKIAALKAGFLNDLNSRLQLGPQAPPKKKEEDAEGKKEEEQKAPLADARKGRARGPARRKPTAAATAPAAAAPAAEKKVELSVVEAWGVWEIGGDGEVVLPREKAAAPEVKDVETEKKAEAAETQAVAAEVPLPGLTTEKEVMQDKEEIEGKTEEPVSAADEPVPVDEEQKAKKEEQEQEQEKADVPPPSLEETETHASTRSDEATQTGQTQMSVQTAGGDTEEFTVHLGGRAPEEGSVVVDAEGKEHVGETELEHLVERTGGGL